MPLAEILWRITPWAERRFLGLIDEIADQLLELSFGPRGYAPQDFG